MRKAKINPKPAPSKTVIAGQNEDSFLFVRRAAFAHSLGELVRILELGTSIVPAIVEVSDNESNMRMQTVLRDVAQRVRGGESLSDALAAQTGGLEEVDLATIRAGEASGTLRESLAAVAQRLMPLGGEAGISVFEVAEFSREFGALVGEGNSLVHSLTTLQEKQASPPFKRIIEEINAVIQKGHPLSGAMGRYPTVFDETYVNAIRAGEVNGTLDWTLHGLTHLDDIVNFDQALQFLGTSKATLYRLLNEDKITGLRVGRQWRFRKADLRAYLEKKPETVSQTEMEGIDEELRYFDTLVGPLQDKPDGETDAESGVVRLVNGILVLAIQAGASDIHLEMARLDGQMVLLLRQRLDGVLHEVRRLPEKLSKPIFNRLKVMSDMNLEERMLPQDGRIPIKMGERILDLLVNLTPCASGWSLVMRILDHSNKLPPFDQIGLHSADHARMVGWLHRPNGLILVAGPTGSGKTTVLYTALQLKVGPEVKTMTIEDPVEYMVPYATQVHVTRKLGLTTASALRAFLRQDPDVIMIGEICEPESAGIAHDAALTGHLVLSSVNARTAGEAVQRMLDLEVNPFIVSSALTGALSLRLVRRNCPDCSAPYTPTPAHLGELRHAASKGGFKMPADAVLKRGVGCDKCRNSGYRGRVGIYELLEMNDSIAAALARRAGAKELQEIAVESGMTTMAADGARKVVDGVTSVEEVLRVLFSTG